MLLPLHHQVSGFQSYMAKSILHRRREAAGGRPPGFRNNNTHVRAAGLLNGGVHGVEERVEEVAVADGIGVGVFEQSVGNRDLRGVSSVTEVRGLGNVDDDFDVFSPESVEGCVVGGVDSHPSDAIALHEVYGFAHASVKTEADTLNFYRDGKLQNASPLDHQVSGFHRTWRKVLVSILHRRREAAGGRPPGFRNNNTHVRAAGLLNGGVHGVEERVEEVAVADGIGVGVFEQSVGNRDLRGVSSVTEVRLFEFRVGNVDDDFDVFSPESVEGCVVGGVDSQPSDAIALHEVYGFGI
nr:hypothetical protein Iba_chr12cCG9640 [Ipomoea batatas]